MAKILVVDDEATITTQLEERLTRLGYEVVGTASSGEEAVEMAGKLKPDLVLMDIVMPGRLDGIEAAERLQDKDVPVVFLTAYGDDRFIRRAKRARPYGYIVKPFQENELKANIELALYNRKVAAGLRRSEERWRRLVENINAGVILGDDKGRIFFWNRGAERIFGYEAQEALGKPLTSLVSEGFRRRYREEIERLVSGGKAALPLEGEETVGLRKDWSKFPLEISLMPWALQGQTMLLCMARDLTSVKQKEDAIRASLLEKKVRLEDLKRQVEENLQAVYTLLELQSGFRRDSGRGMEAGKAETRRQALDLIQGGMDAIKGTERVAFDRYLKKLCDRLFQVYGGERERVRVKVNADEVFLEPQTAVPCGLLAAELVANSLKHAFPGEREGEVEVEFRVEDDRKCRLSVRDDGVGWPEDLDLSHPVSGGLQIVRGLAAQLGGRLRWGRKKGAAVTVTFEKKQ